MDTQGSIAHWVGGSDRTEAILHITPLSSTIAHCFIHNNCYNVVCPSCETLIHFRFEFQSWPLEDPQGILDGRADLGVMPGD